MKHGCTRNLINDVILGMIPRLGIYHYDANDHSATPAGNGIDSPTGTSP